MDATVTVRIAFGSDPFSDTPSWTTVTNDGRAFSITRGRFHELDRMECGTALVYLKNFSHQYYANNAAGANYPNVKPGKRINIRATYGVTTYDLYTGFIEDWGPYWLGPQGALPCVELACADLQKNLARLELNDAVGYSSEASGTRIANVLDDLGYPDDVNHRDLDTGQTTLLASGALADVNALSHLQKVQETELGYMFMDGAGKVVFHDRHARLKSPFTVSQATFGDDTGENRYKVMGPVYGDDYIFNDIRLTRLGGVQQSAADVTSQGNYGKRTLGRTGLIMTVDTEASSMAQYLLSRYKDPVLRAASLEITPAADPASLWPLVLGFDIGTRITVRLNQATIDADYHIEKITHDYNARTDVWKTTWQLSSADNQAYWAIGVAGFSEIGETTKLAY